MTKKKKCMCLVGGQTCWQFKTEASSRNLKYSYVKEGSRRAEWKDTSKPQNLIWSLQWMWWVGWYCYCFRLLANSRLTLSVLLFIFVVSGHGHIVVAVNNGGGGGVFEDQIMYSWFNFFTSWLFLCEKEIMAVVTVSENLVTWSDDGHIRQVSRFQMKM